MSEDMDEKDKQIQELGGKVADLEIKLRIMALQQDAIQNLVYDVIKRAIKQQ